MSVTLKLMAPNHLILIATLTACGPAIIASTERSVTIGRVNEGNLSDATSMAEEHCGRYGRVAEQTSGNVSQELEGKSVAFRCVDSVTPVAAVTATAAPSKPDDKTERKTVTGDKPLFCASTAPDVGLCFLDEGSCNTEKERAGVASCESRSAGSCFSATKTLDGTKLTVCAISIKDCEARRQKYTSDPDFSATPCGIYRKQ